MRKRNTLAESFGVKTMEEEFAMLISDDQRKLQDFLEEDENEKEFNLGCAGLVESNDIDTGESREVLVMIDKDGQPWATISPTFIDSFLTIAHWLKGHGNYPTTVMVQKRNSKRGRSFLACGMGKYKGETE